MNKSIEGSFLSETGVVRSLITAKLHDDKNYQVASLQIPSQCNTIAICRIFAWHIHRELWAQICV